MNETAEPKRRALLVGINLPQTSASENADSLIELGRLVTTLGFEVVATLSQSRQSLAGGIVLGEGKLKEVAAYTGGKGVVQRKAAKKSKAALRFQNETEEEEEEPPLEEAAPSPDEGEKVNAVIFDCELSPSQIANLQNATGVEVLDRTGVIVEIFSRHAKTREARLQVEIARLKYLAPRIRHAGGGGGDRMGKAGESSIELDRRKIRDRISELGKEILAVQKEQSATRSQRAEQQCVALVGYTNAGKSSLMRALTGSQVMVADKLFATLDTTVRALSPETIPRILISDTVGFIKKLPHDLVASFRSTLEEAKNARLLLYVVDASDPSFRGQLKVTQEVLSSIGVDDIPGRLVLNKCDKLSPTEVEGLVQEFPQAIAMSTKDPADVAALRQRLVEFFEEDMNEEEIFVPYTAHQAIGPIRSQVTVVGERHDEQGTFLLVRAHPRVLAKLKPN